VTGETSSGEFNDLEAHCASFVANALSLFTGREGNDHQLAGKASCFSFLQLISLPAGLYNTFGVPFTDQTAGIQGQKQ